MVFPPSSIMYYQHWLIGFLLFYISFENISLIEICHHCHWEARNLGLCSVTTACMQGGIFMVSNLLWQGTLVYTASKTTLFSRLIWQTTGTEFIKNFIIWYLLKDKWLYSDNTYSKNCKLRLKLPLHLHVY